MDDILNLVESKFNGDKKLSWNILCGYILKYDPKSIKDIDMKSIDNVKSSMGLYLSYTLAKLKSAGMNTHHITKFNSPKLKFKLIVSKNTLSPNILFDAILDHCKIISSLYVDFKIKDNLVNQQMFQPLLDDLLLGMKLLGMFDIDKV